MRISIFGEFLGAGFIGPETSGAASSISRNPHVVGYLDNGSGTPFHAFRYDLQTSQLLDLQTLNPANHAGTSSFAWGVNNNGSVIVGFSGTTVSGPDHAFRWTQAGGMVDLGTGEPADLASFSRAYGVSNDGTKIVGTRTYTPPSELTKIAAFLCTFSAGVCTMQNLAGEDGGTATVITPNGTVVAGQGENKAFRWTSAGGTQDLGALAGHTSSAALDISDNGKIVVGVSSLNPVSFGGTGGGVSFDQSNSRAFRWTAATGLQDFRQVLVAHGVNMSGITLVAIRGVTPDGQWIVGDAKTPTTGTNETVPFIAQYCDAAIQGPCQRVVNNDLLIDFGANGLWLRQNNTLWRKIHNASPIAIASGNLDGGTGQTEVLASFSGSGLLARINNANGWTRLHTMAPARLVAGDFNGDGRDEVVADFGASGLWRRASNGVWAKILNATTQGLASGDLDGNGKDELIADRGALGLWAFYNNATWVRLHTANPIRVTSGDLDGNGKDEVIVDFSGSGVWARFNNATWSRLTTLVSQGLATGDFNGDGREDLLADRGPTGLWVRYGNNPSWTKLHAASPGNMTTADLDSNGKAEAIVDFGSSGLFARYNNATWTQLRPWTTQAIAEGRFD